MKEITLTIKIRDINCNKPSCRMCPHFGYYFGYLKKGGKTHSIYIGKKLHLKAMVYKRDINKLEKLKWK